MNELRKNGSLQESKAHNLDDAGADSLQWYRVSAFVQRTLPPTNQVPK